MYTFGEHESMSLRHWHLGQLSAQHHIVCVTKDGWIVKMDLGHIIGEDRLVMLDCPSCNASSHLQPSNSYCAFSSLSINHSLTLRG